MAGSDAYITRLAVNSAAACSGTARWAQGEFFCYRITDLRRIE